MSKHEYCDQLVVSRQVPAVRSIITEFALKRAQHRCESVSEEQLSPNESVTRLNKAGRVPRSKLLFVERARYNLEILNDLQASVELRLKGLVCS